MPPQEHEALRMARLGLAVFPLQISGKVPATKNRFKDATADLDQVRAWIEKYTEGDWGLVPAPPGLDVIVLDVDVKNGALGEERLAANIRLLGPLPSGPEVLSPSGGRHLFFRTPDAHRIPQCGLGGIDVRAADGYVVLAGSRVPEGCWTWTTPLVSLEEIPLLPKRWSEALLAKKLPAVLPGDPFSGASSSEIGRAWVRFLKDGGTEPPVIQEGDRDITLTSIAGSLLNRLGDEQGEIEELLLKVHTTWSAEEQAKKCADLATRAIENWDGSRGAYADNRGTWAWNGKIHVLVTNFGCRILKKLRIDTGSEGETESAYLLQMEIDGRLCTGTLPRSEFRTMAWPDELDSGSGIAPQVYASRPQIATNAIKSVAGYIPEETQYRRTGWGTDDEGVFYIHSGGAIDKAGPSESRRPVGFDPDMKRYSFPVVPEVERRRESVQAALTLLDLAPDEVTVPLFLSAMSAVTSYWMPTGYVVFMNGPTGVLKTSLAVCFQGLFASGKTPVCGWNTTAGGLPGFLKGLPSSLVIVDDFKVIKSNAKEHEIFRTVLHGIADKTPRRRLQRDSSNKPTHAVSPLILVTGERLPENCTVSDRARQILLELDEGDVDKDALTKAQALMPSERDEGREPAILREFTAGFIQWAATNAPNLRLEDELKDARDTFIPLVEHLRTAENLGVLAATGTVVRKYVDEVLGADAPGDLAPRFKAALTSTKLLGWQGGYQASERPEVRALSLTSEAFRTGHMYLDFSGTENVHDSIKRRYGWVEAYGNGGLMAKGKSVGFFHFPRGKPAEVVLVPSAYHNELTSYASKNGNTFPYQPTELRRALAAEGLCLSEKTKNGLNPTVKRKHNGSTNRYLVILDSVIHPDLTDPDDDPPSDF